jgi:uncharacterized membrane protein YphA (DoxX/SURF4 family)
MKWVRLGLRVLVGVGFLLPGLLYFLNAMPPPDGLPDRAVKMMEVLGPSGWLAAVKVLEVVGGLLVLSGRLAPVGLVLVTPVAVNIALWDVCVLGQPGPEVVLTALCLALVGVYWRHFAGVFAPARWV